MSIEGCGTNDRTRIVMNEDALMEYEINRDASKFFSETAEGAEIYIDGSIKYDICERPVGNGKAMLGVRAGTEGVYTISLSGRNIEGWIVELEDILTGEKVNLNECNYTFDTKKEVIEGRFEITFRASSNTYVELSSISKATPKVRIMTIDGMTIFEGSIDEFKSNAIPGVYVVLEGEKSYKIVIR